MAVKEKNLTVKKFGWKRIAKNTERFGWKMKDAVKETTTYKNTSYEGKVYSDRVVVTPHTTTRTKIRMKLNFKRDSSNFINLSSIFILETIYNILFLIRRILATLLPIGYVVLLIIGMFNSSVPNQSDNAITEYWLKLLAFTGVWLFLIICEGILARIAEKILIYKH